MGVMAVSIISIKDRMEAKALSIISKVLKSCRGKLKIVYYPFNLTDEFEMFKKILRTVCKKSNIIYEELKSRQFRINSTLVDIDIYTVRRER